MKNTWLMAVVVMLVLGTAACRKDNKPEQLAALDNAYQSGVITKQEYDAKRLALLGPAPVAQPAIPPANPPAVPPAAAPATVEAPVPPAVDAATQHKTAVAARAKPQPAAQTRTSQHTAAAPNVVQPEPGPPSPAVPPVREPGPAAMQTKPDFQSATAGKAEPPQPGGCADTGAESGSGKEAQQRFYAAPMDEVKRAAAAAFRSLDFNLHKDSGNEMEASKQRHISALIGVGGERLTLHFEPFQLGNRAGTLVTGETRKSFVGKITQKSWTSAVLAQIVCQLRARR